MISAYPKFKKLEVTDKEHIERYTAKFPPYSDYNFFSLWTYNTADDIIFTILHDNLVLRFRDYITNKKFYTFLGTNQIPDTIETLLQLSVSEGLEPVLKLIPHASVKTILPGELPFHIEQDRDNFDYVYLVSDIHELRNSQYHGQRNFINQFNKLYPHCRLVTLDISDDAIQQQIIQLFQVWQRNAKKSLEETDHELIAVKRAITFAHYVTTLSLGIYDNSRLVGFIIADIASPEYAQSHFAKFDTSYKGIFCILFHSLASELFSRHIRYVNNEQDMGIQGLRNAKMQWHPHHFLEKYIISKK